MKYYDKEMWYHLQELNKEGRIFMNRNFIQHGDVSVLKHCLAVTACSIRIAKFVPVKVNRRALIRGALLHDYFLYDWHTPNEGHDWHGFTHPKTALRNAKEDYKLSTIEEDIIKKHMFPLTPCPPMTREAWIVCLADKICASKETIRGFKIRREEKKRSLS